MQGYQLEDYENLVLSVAMTEPTDSSLARHLDKGPRQEDLTFAYWRPSRGATRYTAIIHDIVLPGDGDRILQGNVAFTAEYLQRVLNGAPAGSGIALLHSHLGPGWQAMSKDDEVAERDRMGGAVAARTGHPVLGLTRGTDGAWSARFWFRERRSTYTRRWAATVRVVGERLRISFNPLLAPVPKEPPTQKATISVWGSAAQADVVRSHVGVVGVGSVGSIAAEGLSRLGLEQITYIDHDVIEERNLDRTLGTSPDDAVNKTPKVAVAERTAESSHTASAFSAYPVNASLLSPEGLAASLDCDALLSCVDRPWPTSVLNTIAKAHLIPVVDGGILARVDVAGLPLHVDWRIHTVGPGRACMYCLKALLRSDVALDMAGMLDNPDYIKGMSSADQERFARRNVFPFSLSVAAHQILQLVGLMTGMSRIGGVGPQHYSAYPGIMRVDPHADCDPDCEVDALTASAVDLIPSLSNPGPIQMPLNPVTCAGCHSPRPPELATGAPRTACPKCGESGITVHVNLQEFVTTTDRVDLALTPGDQTRGWERRWKEALRWLDELLRPRTEPLSGEAVHAAAHALHSFYVQTYHLKDALIADTTATGIAPAAVENAITNDPALALLADLANLDKHGNLNRSARSGVVPVITVVEGSSAGLSGWRLHLTIQHGASQLDGLYVAQAAVAAWRAALSGWGLL